MRKTSPAHFIAVAAFATPLGMGCKTDSTNEPEDAAASGPVVEIAVRRLNEGQDVADFEAKRDAFVALLKQQDGVGTDREFQAFFDFASQGSPTPPVYIGMTQYESAEAYAGAGQAIGSSAEAGVFFGTFTPEAFTTLRLLDPTSSPNLAAIANQSGQVLEVAVRDVSKYENFETGAYEAARDTFLDLLRTQPGVVAEYQWISTTDPNIVVGMTVYESQQAFFGVLGNQAFVEDPATTGFLFAYPPTAGYVNVVVK